MEWSGLSLRSFKTKMFKFLLELDNKEHAGSVLGFFILFLICFYCVHIPF